MTSKKQAAKEAIRSSKNWWVLPLVILIGSGLLGFYILKNGTKEVADTTDFSQAALVECANTPEESNIDCWYQRMEVLVAQNDTTDKAFADIETAYQTSAYVKSNCHQIAHIVGRAAGRKYGDVSKAYQDGDDFCWSGYYHGVMEAVVAAKSKDEILNNLSNICSGVRNENLYGFNHFNCVHGLGHGLLQLQGNDLFIALKTCEGLNDSWEDESCYGGVFMENVMNEINPGHVSNYLKDDEPLYPCTAVDAQYKQQCYLMQTSHALKVLNQDFSQVFELCSTVDAPFNETCFQSLGRDASGSTSSDINRTVGLCQLGRDELERKNCYIGAVKDFISYFNDDDQGLALCAAINEQAVKDTCVSTAQTYYSGL